MSKRPATATEPMYQHKPMVMAEIGCNHMGQFEIAKELIDVAKEAGADFVKFQKRCPKELLTQEQYNAPHPVPENSYGKTYGEHREFLELNANQHCDLNEYCKKVGIGYSTSVWDITSAKEIVAINPALIKVGSPSNQHFEMMAVLRDEYEGDVHVSTGMTTKDEIESIVKFFESTGCAKSRLVLYNCTSGYPVPYDSVCLLEIKRLQHLYADRVKHIGFSGHHLGTAIDVAAIALGAVWVERHFTKDCTWKGTDHGASLEPDDLKKLCDDLKATHQAMTYKGEEVLPIENVQRKKLKYGQYNKDEVAKAKYLNAADVTELNTNTPSE
jgi:N-acetylneuraminate synthase